MAPSSLRIGFRRIALVLIVLLATTAHCVGEASDQDLVGPLLFLDHLFGVAAVGSLLCIAFGVGHRLLRSPVVPDPTPFETLIGKTFLGTGVIATSILVIGLTGMLVWWVMVGLGVILVVFGRSGLALLPCLFTEGLRELDGQGKLALGLLSGVMGLLLLLTLEPPVSWDTLMYHQRIPMQFLERGEIFVPEDNLHVAFVSLIHMLYLPLLAAGVESGPQILNGAFAGLLGLSIITFGGRLFSDFGGALGQAVLWASTIVLLVATTGRVDVTLAAFVFLAHVVALASPEDDPRPLLFAALMAGFAAGIKYHGLLYIVTLAPLFAWKAWRSSSGPRSFLRLSGIVAGLVALAGLPWFLKNALLLGSPVFPFLAETNVAPWLLQASAGRLEVSGGLEGYSAVFEARRSFDPVRLFTDPGSLSVEGEADHHRYSPLLLFSLIGLPALRDRRLAWLILPAFAYAIAIPLIQATTNLRYFIPVVGALSLGAGVVVSRLARRITSGTRAVVLGWVIVVMALIPTTRWVIHESDPIGHARHALGLASSQEVLLSNPNVAGLVAVADSVNRRLDADDRLLMFFEARGLYFEADVIQDNVLTNWALLDEAGLAKGCLRSIDSTHVLMNVGALNYYLARGVDPDAVHVQSLEAFVPRCLRPLVDLGGFVLFRIVRVGEDGASRRSGETSGREHPASKDEELG